MDVRTYPMHKEGRLVGFQFDNVYLSVRKAADLLSEVSGVTDVELRKPFSAFDGAHIRFKYQGEPLLMLEPFGDNSRYLIGLAEPSEATPDVQPLQAAFDGYQPNLLRKLMGDLLTLNLAGLGRR